MNETQEKLLQILSHNLFGVGEAITEKPSAELLKEARQQAVYSVVTSENAMPYIMNNMRILQAHYELCKLLSEHDIPATTIKGYASSYYYPEPIKRTLGDVDFYVKMEEREKVDRLLLAEGYTVFDRDNIHHWVYEKNGVHYELHWRVSGIPEGEPGKRIEVYMADLLAKARKVMVGNGELTIPSDFHNGLIMILHMARHMTSSGMGLRHLCDWACFVGKVEHFPEMFERCFRELGLWHYACLLTEISVRYLGLPKQEWSAKEGISQKAMAAVLDDILGQGNFGHKQSGTYSHILMDNIETDSATKKRGIFGNLIHSFNEKAHFTLPITKKVPILLPIGWICVACQFIWRILRGKRKMVHPVKMVTMAKERSEIHKELRLFEQE